MIPKATLFLYIYLYQIYFIFQNGQFFFGTFGGLLGVLSFIFHAFIFQFVIFGLLHTWFLSFIIGITFLEMGLIRMTQILIVSRDQFRITSRNIVKIQQIIIESLVFVGKNNWIFGRAILAFFTFMTPINILYVVYILFIELTFIQRLIIAFFIVGEGLGIFLIHFTMAKYSKQIHKPGKILLCKLARNQHSNLNIVSRIRFVNLIGLLHTQRQYGITYGPLGLITMNTFAKFMILYGKFVLITYKLYKKINRWPI